MSQSSIGIIGLATMGAHFAQNFASKDIQISVFNRTFQKTSDLLSTGYTKLKGFEKLTEFVESLEKPRKILLLVKSGEPVDQVLVELQPLLDSQDIVVDCGNSNWKDTIRRQKIYSNDLGIFDFVGCGISGGEEGALYGPSLMPSGKASSVAEILPLLEKVAAKDFQNKPCVTNVGVSAAGHFVKMVHNGIEYAIMQGIAEIYDILRKNGYSNLEMSEIFDQFNQGELKSFLLDITVEVLKIKDNLAEGFLVDKILARAGAKGTGAWTVEAGMEMGVAVPSIAAAVFARTLSGGVSFARSNKSSSAEIEITEKIDLNHLQKLLETVYKVAYLQGLELIYKANEIYNWQIDVDEITRIWQGGCIIRSRMLENLTSRYFKVSSAIGVEMPEIDDTLLKLGNKLPLPVIHSSIDYLATIMAKNLPTNLIQAQRDYFGAHTYQRIDREGTFTGGWSV